MSTYTIYPFHVFPCEIAAPPVVDWWITVLESENLGKISKPFGSMDPHLLRKDHLDSAKEDLKTWQGALKKLKEGACDFLGRKMIQ